MNPRYKMIQSLVLGGILPVIAFTVIEEKYGTVWGLVAGMVFGLGEILYSWRTQGRVDPMTWGGNGLLLVLGGVSLVTQEGIWFKLQPSLIEGAMALALWISVLMGKPILVSALKKQLIVQGNPAEILPVVSRALAGMTIRVGVFFALHAGLAAWAALHWSTAAWAALKGIGFTISMVVYMVAESLLLRYRIAQSNIKGSAPPSSGRSSLS
jgi:intracellular septation protein